MFRTRPVDIIYYDILHLSTLSIEVHTFVILFLRNTLRYLFIKNILRYLYLEISVYISPLQIVMAVLLGCGLEDNTCNFLDNRFLSTFESYFPFVLVFFCHLILLWFYFYINYIILYLLLLIYLYISN